MKNREFIRFQDMPVKACQITPYIAVGLIEHTSFKSCALAARLSHESWNRSSPDSDLDLMGRLSTLGDEHSKALRWLQYCLAIEAPRYWWAEMDTYTVGVTPMGSTSTMHKEAKRLSGDELVEFKSNMPEGTLQLRIRGFSWHTLQRIVEQRHDHRLQEWVDFCSFATRISNLSIICET